MEILPSVIILIVVFVVFILKNLSKLIRRRRRKNYYRNVYLKSEEWKRKRYVVLKRDNWKCVICGAKATEVHHKKYLRKKIGKEPIDWLISICKPCHYAQHR